MLSDYVATVRMLFRDAEGLEIEEALADMSAACIEVRQAYEQGASEQEACDRLLRMAAEW